jgi:predicted phosphodiesterase
MKIAIFSDIHGNLVSLEAVLADIEREGIEQMVC